MTGFPETDQEFIGKLTEIILASLSDENFGVKELIAGSGMTYTSLSRKLKNITGKNINQFIRDVRLEKAFGMLKEGKITASEAAYKTGFGSPAYFNTCFHEYFGYPPGQVRKEKSENGTGTDHRQIASDYNPGRLKGKRIIYVASAILIISFLTYQGYILLFRGNVGEKGDSSIYGHKSIAVLPFANFSPDSENEYFCKGITDEILNQLFKIKDLKVKARTSVEKYRNAVLDTKVIGKELDVSLLMEGSVRKSGDDLRITVQLIDASTGNHLWSETYDGKYTPEIFVFQSSVAKRVAESLGSVITPQEGEKVDFIPTKNMQAHDLYMRGLEMHRKGTEGNGLSYHKLALNLFNQALEADPDFAEALLMKSRCYYFLGNHDSSFYYARKTLEIHKDNSRAQANMAYYYFYTNVPDSALKYWKKSAEDPNFDELHWSYLGIGQVLFFQMNKVIESVQYFQKAFDAGGDTISSINMVIGMLFYSVGDFNKAYKYARKALFYNPACFLVGAPFHSLLADRKYDRAFAFVDSLKNVIPCEVACHIMKVHAFTVLKEYDSAGIYLAKFYKPGDMMRDLYINYLLIETGRRNESMVSLQDRISYQRQEAARGRLPWPSQHFEILAASYALTGEREKCLECLSEIEKRGCSDVPAGYIIFPGFDYLRNDPEFKAIIKRIEKNKAVIREEIRKMERRGEIRL